MRRELESIYRTAPVGLAVLDTELRFVRINERLAEINGFSVAQHIGRTVGELLPDIAAQAEAMLKRVIETGQPIRDLEIRGQTPARPGVERIWVEQITPLYDSSGQLEGLSVVAEEVTDQRIALAALKRSEETLSLAMDAAGLAAWEWNVQTNHLTFASHWEHVLGYEQVSGQSVQPDWGLLLHPEDHESTSACVKAHVEGQSPIYECEYRLRHADGHWVWIASRGRIVERDGQGRALRMVGVGRDVTAERSSKEQIERQAQLIQLAFDAIFTWTDEEGIQFWNLGAERQYGFTAAEALGVHPDKLLETHFPCPKENVRAELQSEGLWRGELIHKTKAGLELTVTAALQLVDGTRAETLEITRDVTETKRAELLLKRNERELRQSQERLQVALDAGRMGVWDWTPGKETFWSAEVYKLLGLPSDSNSPEAFHFLQMIHPDDRAKLDAEIGRVLVKGGDYESEFRIVRGDGQVRWLVSRGRVMHDDSGKQSRLVGVNFDITDRKLIEEAMREADKRRTEFLAMLAHELRNPLAPIVNAVRLLEVVGDSVERRTAATQILRRQTAQMARLVDDLLEASRITQGRIELRIENVLLASCAFQAVEAARAQALAQNQTLTFNVPPNLDLVADPARLTQIISNLVTNAVKYTQLGGRIEVTAQPECEDQLSIIVQDNGPGVSADLLPRVFDLFTQDQSTLHRSQGGLGIGLALVQRLAELHGGHVRYESRPDGQRGARFVVCLPRNGRRAELRRSVTAGDLVRVPPMPMLVVDDNEDAAQTLATLLRLDGHRVDVVHDGERALEAMANLHPKVVILDLGLPKLDGLSVAKQIRQDARLAGTILIAVSGYAQEADLAATKEAGFDAHFPKPVELASIYRAIENADPLKSDSEKQ